MSKIKIKLFYIIDISKDFYIEAMASKDSFDFWLCRKNYCQKEYVYGVPYPQKHRSKEKEMVMIEENKINLKDPDYMSIFCEELLDENEMLGYSFQIL